MKRDPVTPSMRLAVLERDAGCAAVLLGADPATCAGRATLDHIQDGYGRMGKRAPSDLAHLVTLCWDHHLNGWATSHRPELRRYLESVNEHTHVEPVFGCPACRAAVGSEK